MIGRLGVGLAAALSALAPTEPAPASLPRVVVAVAPQYASIPWSAHISGSVTVKVDVDARGKVEEACAVDGHVLLRPSALAAARLWEFEPRPEPGQAELVFSYVLLPPNACWLKTLPRFVPPARVEIAEREAVTDRSNPGELETCEP